MRFNDLEYIRRYKEYGEFPHIHDDIFAISRHLTGENVLDLGCCIGMLSLRLAKRNKFVLGVEAHEPSVKSCIPADNVEYRCMRVSASTLDDLSKLLDEYHIQTVYARRVMPELFETGGMELVISFIKMCHGHNVTRFVIEGRKDRKGSTNPLSCVQKETKAFQGFYDIEKSFKECRILKIVK